MLRQLRSHARAFWPPTPRRQHRFHLRLLGVAATTAGLLLAAPITASAGTVTSSDQISRLPVSFTVQNVNHSKIPCDVDGKTYQVRGRLVGSAQDLANPQSVTLVLHGLSYGAFFADYTAQPGYNFAEKQAASGHVTVVVDRLGYGESDKPVGQDICFGSRADVAHQMVEQLRAGSYSTQGGSSPAFGQVVLAGHSVGAIIAQAEAYSFGDIDGLLLLSYSDTDVSVAARTALATAISDCQAGGGRQNGTTGQPGYVYFGASTPQMFIGAHFYTPNADPAVVDTTANLRSHDPCGDILSYKAAVATNLANIGSISVPTLVVTGLEDAIYPVVADKQASLLTGASDVTAVTIPGTGHALTLHRSADQFAATVEGWLADHGFGGWVMPVGAPDTGGGSTATSMAPATLAGAGILLLLTSGLVAVRSRRRPIDR